MNKPEVRFERVKLNENISVGKKRVRQQNGQFISVYSIDSNSPQFASQLGFVFAKNVAEARKANRSIVTTITKSVKRTKRKATKSKQRDK
jgi:hypothetical protein